MPSPMVSRVSLSACLVAVSALLAACGHDGGGSPPAPLPLVPSQPLDLHWIGGTVVGSTGALTLQNTVNGSTENVATAGTFSFATQLAQGANYTVVVAIPPIGQSCTVANGSGTMGLANISNIAVNCTTNGLTLGGVVSGLGAGKTLVLRAAADFTTANLSITTNGAFTFPETFVPNAEYEVFVVTQPADQTCTVLNATGDFASQPIANVNVSCIDSSASNRNWQTAVNVSTDTDLQDANGMRTPRVGVDAAGNALAVWSADREGDSAVDILWSRKPAGGAWTAPAQIPDWLPPVPDPAFREVRRDPVLFVAPNGSAVAAWRQGPRFMGYDVMASFYTPASGWGTPQYVFKKHDDMPSGADDLQISQDSAGNTLVVWVAIGQIWYNRHTPGSGWTYDGNTIAAGTIINDLMGAARLPKLAQNAAGQAVVIWEQGGPLDSPLDDDLWSTRYDVTTDTWSTPQAVEVMGGLIYGTSLVIDSAGAASAFWGQNDGGRLRVRTSRLAAGSWTAPSNLETGNTNPTGFAMDPQAVIDGSGDIMVVWQQGNIDSADFVAKRFVEGTGWLEQQPIGVYSGSSSPIFDTTMVVAGNAAGHVVAVWAHSNCVMAENVPCPVDVNANEFNPVNGEWGAEEVIDKEETDDAEMLGDALTPSVAVAPSGNAVAVWDQDGGPPTNGIRSAVFE
jgi:hypothetical protein